MGRWRYIAQRLTGTGDDPFLDWDVPLSQAQITDVISGDCSLQGTITPAYARLIGSDGLPILLPWETAIWAEEEGVIRGGGILTETPIEDGGLGIDCVGYTGYLADMPYEGAGDYFVKTDPLDIVRYIWANVQQQPHGQLNFEIAPTKSKVTIGTELTQAEYDGQSGDATYQAGPYKLAEYQDTDLSSNISDLASTTPFDYHERHYWDGDTLRHHLDIGYPSLGRTRNDLRFMLGENVRVAPKIDRTGDDYATDVLVLGAGNGSTMKRAKVNRQRRGLRRVAVVTDSSLNTAAQCTTRAQAELNWRKVIEEYDTFDVSDHPNAPLGSVTPGDVITIGGRLDWETFETQVRVTQIVTKPESGVQTFTVVRTDKISS